MYCGGAACCCQTIAERLKTLFDHGSGRNQKDKESENLLFYKYATPTGFNNFEIHSQAGVCATPKGVVNFNDLIF
jgi:hypothetical protein